MLMFVGCGAQPGTNVVKYEKGGLVRMTEAPKDATYALYGRSDMSAQIKYTLTKGDKIGFVEEAGKVYAVAGTHKDELKIGTMTGYYWKMQDK